MRSTTAQNWPHKRKTSVFQIKPSQFRVIARPQRGRGNLKAEGMAFLGEARCPCETDFKHFGNKNGRFYCKTYHFCVIARPQSGRGNLKAEGMASRSEARDRKPTKSRNSDLNRHGATPPRRFSGSAISRGRTPAFPVRSIFHTIKIVFHGAATLG